MMKDDLFRTDLYFRMNTIQIEIPPLRVREEDILKFTMHFLQYYSQKYDKPGLKFTSSSLARIQDYDWPGNVRELKHTIERAVILSDSNTVDPQLLGLHRQEREYIDSNEKRSMEEYEKEIISRILKRNSGNISHTAGELKLSRQTLYRKIQKYGI